MNRVDAIRVQVECWRTYLGVSLRLVRGDRIVRLLKARLGSEEARRRPDNLQARLHRRLGEPDA